MIDCWWKVAIHQARTSLCVAVGNERTDNFSHSLNEHACWRQRGSRVISFSQISNTLSAPPPTTPHFIFSTIHFTAVCSNSHTIEQWSTACWLLWFNELSASIMTHCESSLPHHIKASNQTWPLVPSLTLSHDFTLLNNPGRNLKKKKIFVWSDCRELLIGDDSGFHKHRLTRLMAFRKDCRTP